MYYGGLNAQGLADIQQVLPIPQGELPFRYLGVPLSAKKLSYSQCKPLLEQILARFKCWTTKFLSYAGRLQLIRGVIFGMQSYWAQIFVLPKKVMKEIETCCRIFLWTGHTSPSRKVLISWTQICLPKVSGGWNVISLSLWNKVAVAQHLWSLAHKADVLWVKWVHTYYIKRQSLWGPSNCSWVLKKILFSCGWL